MGLGFLGFRVQGRRPSAMDVGVDGLEVWGMGIQGSVNTKHGPFASSKVM